MAAAIATTTDPREIGNIITSIVPHIGITEDEKGNLIANNNKNGVQAVINPPGFSVIDAAQVGSIGAAFTPAGQLAALPAKALPSIAAGPLARFGMGATTAGATQAGIETLQEQMGGEFNSEEVAIAVALGGVAEVVMPAIQALRQSKLSREATAAGEEIGDVAAQISKADDAATATGIRLFPAQKTTIPEQLEKQSFVSQLSAGTKRSTEQLRLQNQETVKAVDDFLDMIASPDSVITGASKTRTAAKNAVLAAKRIRRDKASPLYTEAFENVDNIDVSTIINKIEGELSKLPKGGEVSGNLNKVKGFIDGDLSIEQLHNVKIEIDQMINKTGENSLGNTTKRKLESVQTELLKEMDKASDLYKQARAAFAEASPQVDAITDSIVGKIAKMDDTQLKGVSKKIFDPSETNLKVIKEARKAIEGADPSAWSEIVRTEFERRLGSVRSTLEEGTTENIPGQMYRAIFGNSKQRDVLFASVDGESKKNLRYLEVALNRARLGRSPGSPTATREAIKDELKGGAATFFRDIFKTPLSSVASASVTGVTGATADASFNANVRALADVMFNPKWSPKMKELRTLKADSPAAVRALVQIVDDAVIGSAELVNDVMGQPSELEKSPE